MCQKYLQPIIKSSRSLDHCSQKRIDKKLTSVELQDPISHNSKFTKNFFGDHAIIKVQNEITNKKPERKLNIEEYN